MIQKADRECADQTEQTDFGILLSAQCHEDAFSHGVPNLFIFVLFSCRGLLNMYFVKLQSDSSWQNNKLKDTGLSQNRCI